MDFEDLLDDDDSLNEEYEELPVNPLEIAGLTPSFAQEFSSDFVEQVVKKNINLLSRLLHPDALHSSTGEDAEDDYDFKAVSDSLNQLRNASFSELLEDYLQSAPEEPGKTELAKTRQQYRHWKGLYKSCTKFLQQMISYPDSVQNLRSVNIKLEDLTLRLEAAESLRCKFRAEDQARDKLKVDKGHIVKFQERIMEDIPLIIAFDLWALNNPNEYFEFLKSDSPSKLIAEIGNMVSEEMERSGDEIFGEETFIADEKYLIWELGYRRMMQADLHKTAKQTFFRTGSNEPNFVIYEGHQTDDMAYSRAFVLGHPIEPYLLPDTHAYICNRSCWQNLLELIAPTIPEEYLEHTQTDLDFVKMALKFDMARAFFAGEWYQLVRDTVTDDMLDYFPEDVPILPSSTNCLEQLFDAMRNEAVPSRPWIPELKAQALAEEARYSDKSSETAKDKDDDEQEVPAPKVGLDSLRANTSDREYTISIDEYGRIDETAHPILKGITLVGTWEVGDYIIGMMVEETDVKKSHLSLNQIQHRNMREIHPEYEPNPVNYGPDEDKRVADLLRMDQIEIGRIPEKPQPYELLNGKELSSSYTAIPSFYHNIPPKPDKRHDLYLVGCRDGMNGPELVILGNVIDVSSKEEVLSNGL